MTEPKRVLLLITDMGRGGAQRQVVDIATKLRARGSVVAILSMMHPVDFTEELSAGGVALASLEMKRGRPTPAALLRYVSFVRRWRPDVVHSHMVHANLLARVGHILVPSVPIVCTVHSIVEGRRWREIAYRLTDQFADATTAVSKTAAERYVRVGAVPPGRLITIPNGFDFSRDAVNDGARDSLRRELRAIDSFVWVTVGRLVPEKGHDLLLRAFREVNQSKPAARLVIVGDGPQRPDLERTIADLGLQQSVTLLGQRRDVATILAASDAFVLSSLWEGLPIVLLEAAAEGLPIVSTDVGGCSEVAKPALGAVLTETTSTALAQGMLDVMTLTAAERSTVGSDLRAYVRSEFDMDAIILRWEQLYASVIAH